MARKDRKTSECLSKFLDLRCLLEDCLVTDGPIAQLRMGSYRYHDGDDCAGRATFNPFASRDSMTTISSRMVRRWVASGCIASTLIAGCAPVDRFRAWRDSADTSYYQSFVTQIEFPDVSTAPSQGALQTVDPLALQNPSELPSFDLTLQDAIRLALESSDVLRNLGGTVVAAPQGSGTEYDPALTELNPLGGTQAALAAYDATVGSQLFWQKTDPPTLPGGGIENLFVLGFGQTQGNYQNQIQKRTATGATYALRSNMAYNRFDQGSFFAGALEAEWRQPMMQGAGTTFNLIAGPNAPVGSYNGVFIARINTDISLAQFESGVIQLVDDVEDAYWNLYFAYRNLDALLSGRESALRAWQQASERLKIGLDARDSEAQARAFYYQFSSQVNDALSGTAGLYASEQALRYMIGFPATDGRLIRPSTDPLQAMVMFDWQSALNDAINNRVEIRQQQWTIKRRELELIAARLNRRARFDALSQYRIRGVGDHLTGSEEFFGSFGSLDFQEWRSGLEWSFPVGLRQASAAQRSAQLNLSRDMAILEEQQLRISHNLSTAARQIARSYEQLQINYNRVEADKAQVEVLEARFKSGRDNIRFLLQAQQQLAQSNSALFRALVDYNLAVRDFHREKGSLLTYNQVSLTENALDGSMLAGAYQRGRFLTPRDNPEQVQAPAPVSRGGFDPSTIGVPSGFERLPSPNLEIVEPR
jgi:outer membrane protein TolC